MLKLPVTLPATPLSFANELTPMLHITHALLVTLPQNANSLTPCLTPPHSLPDPTPLLTSQVR